MSKKKKKKNRNRKRGGQKAPKRTTPAAVSVKPSRKLLLDIIVPIYGEWALAESAISSIAQGLAGWEKPAYRVIVLDNGTPEFNNETGETITPAVQAAGVKDMLRKGDKFIRLDENRGFPGGMNYAVSKGTAPLILVLSADIVLIDGAINHLLKEMDNPDIGVAGMKLLFPEIESPHGPAGKVQHAGHAIDISGKIIHIHLGWSREHPKVNIRREMASVTGACFMTRRNLWEEMGGLYEGYGKGTFEDVDYCFTIREHGKKVVYVPNAEAYHIVGGSINQGAGAEGFNLPVNEQIFRGRWVHRLEWDVYRYV